MPGVLIQPRDLAILESLSTARFLTAEAIAWLHFPTWAAHERADRQRQTHTATPQPSYPRSHVYRRLKALYDVGLITTIGRSHDVARRTLKGLPDTHALTERGAALLASRTTHAIEDLWWEATRTRSVQNLEHCVQIGRVYAALRVAAVRDGVPFTAWQGDHRLSAPHQYDRVAIVGQRDALPIIPDATVLLDNRRYFIEVDRGTRPLRSWAEKAQAYQQYRHHPLLQERYGCTAFGLLIIAPDATRQQRIAQTITQATAGAAPHVLLTSARMLHPHRIRGNWETITAVTTSRRQVAQTLHTHSTPVCTPAALWAAATAGTGNVGGE